MIGWVILAITLALPLVYVIVFFTYGRKWDLPAGTKVEGEYEGYKAILIYGKGADDFFAFNPRIIANACALGAWSIGTRWVEKRGSRKGDPAKLIVVHVLNDTDYHATYDGPVSREQRKEVKSNGMLKSVSRKMGRGELPLVACRASAFSSTPLTGSLVVHELTHYIVDEAGLDPWENAAHTTPGFFYGTGSDALEVEASKRYVSKRDQIGIKV